MCSRLAPSVYTDVFTLVLRLIEFNGLLRGKVMEVDSTYLRADASMKGIVRKDTGESYATYLKRLCEEDGIARPTTEDARRMDRTRKGKKTSNHEWKSPVDDDARIVKLKDGRTRLGYKAEHVVDLETGVILAAEVYHGNEADTATLRLSLEASEANHVASGVTSTAADITEDDEHDDDSPPPTGSSGITRDVVKVVADKGYHKVELLLELRQAGYRTYIPGPDQKGARHFDDKGGMRGREAFYDNRKRVKRKKAKAYLRLRGERIERTFAHACETGAHRRVRLRGLENVRKRYVAHLAAVNLGLLVRSLFGYGTPRQMANSGAKATAHFTICLPTCVLNYWVLFADFAYHFSGIILPRATPKHGPAAIAV